MTVVYDSTSRSDHSVGLVAISRHQGYWSHSPRRQFQSDPSQEFKAWLSNNLGQGASRLQRTPLSEQFTGHTAVLSRVDGHVAFVRGFVPNVLGYLQAFFGRGGRGHWQDDYAMLSDPTAISFEIPVTRTEAQGFQTWFNNSSGAINVYALRNGNASSTFNCVLGATTVLVNYLTEVDGDYSPYVRQLLTVNDSMQGHLMQGMTSGFQ